MDDEDHKRGSMRRVIFGGLFVISVAVICSYRTDKQSGFGDNKVSEKNETYLARDFSER